MAKLGFTAADYALGHTKLFLRPVVLARLEALREASERSLVALGGHLTMFVKYMKKCKTWIMSF